MVPRERIVVVNDFERRGDPDFDEVFEFKGCIHSLLAFSP